MNTELDQGREYWLDRFTRQKTARLQTLRECAEELYGQGVVVRQTKDMTYKVVIPGVISRHWLTIREAGLALTSEELHNKIVMALETQHCTPDPVEPKGLVPFLKSLFNYA